MVTNNMIFCYMEIVSLLYLKGISANSHWMSNLIESRLSWGHLMLYIEITIFDAEISLIFNLVLIFY